MILYRCKEELTKEFQMTKKREMMKARVEELVKQGISKELAKIMAKAEFENGIYISRNGSVVY